MDKVPESARATARAAAAAFGGTPTVRRYHDRDETYSVDILECRDRPTAGFVSYSTLGLHSLLNMVEKDDIRIEMAGVASERRG